MQADAVEWQEARQREYAEAEKALQDAWVFHAVFNPCVYDMPILDDRLFASLREGLDILAKQWAINKVG